MYQFSTLLLALSVAGSVTAAPTHVNKRIDQTTSASTTKWEGACNAANGGSQCNTIAVNAFGTLLAAAGPCDQQDSADTMMDLSKKLNSADMIKFAQIFCQQPRNSPDSLSVPYCQKAPRNAELNGAFQCQFQGVNPTQFTGGLTAGQPGTIPFGQSKVLNPPGSCPANPSGPITDGDQLSDLVTSSGLPSGSSAGNGNSQNQTSASPSPAQSSVAPPAASVSDTPASSSAAVAPVASASATPASSSAAVAPVASASATPVSSPAAAAPSSQASSGAGFAAQNGQDAQALNQQFQSLTPNSPCTDGQSACVQGDFAQCVNGKFATTPCSSGLQCFALPLVNSRGTSVTCATQADANTRIATALGN